MAAYGTILLLIALGRLFAAGRVLPENAADTLNRAVASDPAWDAAAVPSREGVLIAQRTTRPERDA